MDSHHHWINACEESKKENAKKAWANVPHTLVGAEKRTQVVSRRIDRRRRKQIFSVTGSIGESEGIMFELSTSFKNGHGGANR